ncbi:MAG: YHS domain-containing protein [Candidatus Latescibacterota bacterium]|jgi:YHS domain-containing protein
MKHWIVLFIIAITGSLTAQKHVNLKKGFAAEGYDVVAYFSNEALKGDKEFTVEFEGVSYKFSSEENKQTFIVNPSKYVPQYGGYCAYAVGLKNEKIGVNPKTYQIIDGKLYLFYNSFGVNTLEKWNEEGAGKLKQKADLNWNQIIQN